DDELDVTGRHSGKGAVDLVRIERRLFYAVSRREVLISLDRTGDEGEKVARVPEEGERTDKPVEIAGPDVDHDVQDSEQDIGQTDQQIRERQASERCEEGKPLQEDEGDEHRDDSDAENDAGSPQVNEHHARIAQQQKRQQGKNFPDLAEIAANEDSVRRSEHE